MVKNKIPSHFVAKKEIIYWGKKIKEDEQRRLDEQLAKLKKMEYFNLRKVKAK